MNFLTVIQKKLASADPESVAAYQTVLPRQIDIKIKKDGQYFIATVKSIEDKPVKGSLMTEAKDFDSLIENVNDLIFTKVNMPSHIRPYYGTIFRPEGYRKDSTEMLLVKA